MHTDILLLLFLILHPTLHPIQLCVTVHVRVQTAAAENATTVKADAFRAELLASLSTIREESAAATAASVGLSPTAFGFVNEE